MKRAVLLQCLVIAISAVPTATAQEIYPGFALVVQIPGYETFLKNLGDAPIKIDGYHVASLAGSLSPDGWVTMDSAGPEIVDALGPGADGFFAVNPSSHSLAELNPASSATFQPGQSWSIGFPFNSADPNFVLDAVFQIASPDGLVLTGGTVVPPGELAAAPFVVIPEPSSGALCLLTGAGIFAFRCRERRWITPVI